MTWNEYALLFRNAAYIAQKPEEYVVRCLAYARKLWEHGVPIIYDEDHLCRLVGYSSFYVLGAAYSTRQYYRDFEVAKKSGGTRLIQEPLPSLKEIQRWILENMLYPVPVHSHAKGFVKGRSIKDNAKYHLRQPFVVSLDMKDFFPSIPRHRVYGLFRSLGYSQAVSNLLGRICTLENRLPQGAPTSPAITNLICRSFDRRLAGFARKKRLRYTRYADDVTISGDLRPGEVLRFVEMVAKEEGLVLHPEKIRVLEPHQRQKVTGIVVNEKLQAPRDLRRKLRQELYFIKKFGLDGHLAHTGETRRNYVRHILGLANFVRFVNPDDATAAEVFAVLVGEESTEEGETQT